MKKSLIAIFIVLACAFNSFALEIQHEMGTASFKSTPKKVLVLDWALAETILSLGIEPQGIADAKGYQQWVVEPRLNANVIDLGSRREPNLELLAELKPDVILMSQHMAVAFEPLNKIAPVMVYSLYSDKKRPLDAAMEITRSLGVLFNKEQQAHKLIEQTKLKLQQNGEQIRSVNLSNPPLLFVRFMNDKTLRIHGRGSLIDATVNSMGLNNDWQDETNLWGFTTVGTEKVAEHQKATVTLFGPLTQQQRDKLSHSPLWQAMAFTRTQSVHELPAIWTFGGLIAAQRLSDHLTQQLTKK
ncbi:peptide ABC transporter substrate-binding protein [Vibrio azureus]|uniref:iron-siderophore ABC transporter substrate-binding protein n=1 Tax=Vibrio azureus TaxID=512649 RepID=UPI0003A1ADDD|nr:iron-siderophore ABC transporter substrate-binding protein [Vibrio azureus]AUI86326.1 peptide ABC transporter substrate-binding protein [Vibrio azureus]